MQIRSLDLNKIRLDGEKRLQTVAVLSKLFRQKTNAVVKKVVKVHVRVEVLVSFFPPGVRISFI